jgi:hypothetical protein
MLLKGGGASPEIAKYSCILGPKLRVLLTFNGKFWVKGGPGPPPFKSTTATSGPCYICILKTAIWDTGLFPHYPQAILYFTPTSNCCSLQYLVSFLHRVNMKGRITSVSHHFIQVLHMWLNIRILNVHLNIRYLLFICEYSNIRFSSKLLQKYIYIYTHL